MGAYRVELLRTMIAKEISAYLVGDGTDWPKNLRSVRLTDPSLRAQGHAHYAGVKRGDAIGFRIAATTVGVGADDAQHIAAAITIAITDPDDAVREIWIIDDPDMGSDMPDPNTRIAPALMPAPDGSHARIPNTAVTVATLWAMLEGAAAWITDFDAALLPPKWFRVPPQCENRAK